MNFLSTLAAFLGAITLLVFIHEYGHFKVARLCGVKVRRFSIGFGKPFYTRVDKQGTEWAVAPFPLGGYVSMVDTRVEAPAPGEESMAFDKKPLWKRAAIVAAGPLINLVFAWAAWSVLLSGSSEELGPYLGSFFAGSPAQKAGMTPDDEVVAVDGAPTRTLNEVHMALTRAAMAGSASTLTLRRGASEATATLDMSKLDAGKLASGEGLRSMGFANPAGSRLPPRMKSLIPGGAGALAGFKPGETVVSIDGVPTPTWSAMGAIVNASADKPLRFVLRSAEGSTREVVATPKVPAGAADGSAKIGAELDSASLPAEIKAKAYVTVSRGPLAAMGESAKRCAEYTKLTLQAMGSLFSGHASSDSISGPVGIAKQAGDAAEGGGKSYGGFLAYLSLSLFIMNLLPLPGLDGGHLAMFAYEGVARRPLSEKAQARATRFGFSVLAMLMLFAFVNDISKLFH